jgi:hypothetical protein
MRRFKLNKVVCSASCFSFLFCNLDWQRSFAGRRRKMEFIPVTSPKPNLKARKEEGRPIPFDKIRDRIRNFPSFIHPFFYLPSLLLGRRSFLYSSLFFTTDRGLLCTLPGWPAELLILKNACNNETCDQSFSLYIHSWDFGMGTKKFLPTLFPSQNR